jgi:transcriptional regulator with XRE-family HTH domain
MSKDFDKLIADIEREAHEEGPRAVRELEQFRAEFGLASQLIQSRREGKLSQRELAKLSGVPQSEISRIETGAANPTHATINALLRPLGKRIQLVDDAPTTASATRAGETKRATSKTSRARKPGKVPPRGPRGPKPVRHAKGAPRASQPRPRSSATAA